MAELLPLKLYPVTVTTALYKIELAPLNNSITKIDGIPTLSAALKARVKLRLLSSVLSSPYGIFSGT